MLKTKGARDAALKQLIEYAQTVLGYHAGVSAITLVLFDGVSFYFGVIRWADLGTLDIQFCDEPFKLTT